MGRGRQKAKHTKVARELKYFSPDTDLSQLERELSTGGANAYDEPDDENLDKWADYANDSYESGDESGADNLNK